MEEIAGAAAPLGDSSQTVSHCHDFCVLQKNTDSSNWICWAILREHMKLGEGMEGGRCGRSLKSVDEYDQDSLYEILKELIQIFLK